jgi:hypothetical protein
MTKLTAHICYIHTVPPEPDTEPPPRYKDKYSDPRKRPFAVFEFRYRSKGQSSSNLSLHVLCR